MTETTQIVITIVSSVLASSGVWAFIIKILDRRSAQNKVLIGLAHDRIMYLGAKYIARGYITVDEYENLHDYLYIPYKEMGGNGTAAKLMLEVDKLPIKK